MHLSLNVFTLLGLAVIIGFYVGQGARKTRLPSLIGYMLLGVIAGESGLGVLDEHLLERLAFISELTLAFVAFSIGTELNLSSLRKLGGGIVSIILAESFAAFILVTLLMYAFTRDLPLALIFGAMAPASAPAGTVHVIQEYRAKGTLTKALYAVVGFDDGLAIIIFGFASAVAHVLLVSETTATQSTIIGSMGRPLVEIILSLICGGILGLIFSLLMRMIKAERESIIVVVGFVFLATGVSQMLHLSLILTNMVIGFVFVNTRRPAVVQRVTNLVHITMAVFFVLFFTLAGAHMRISALSSLGMVGIVYIIGRSVGLIGGARIGGMIGRVEPKIKKYIGIGILSQAGVAIGLSLIAKHELDMIGTEHAIHIGAAVLTTITATCIFFEIIGPILTRYALEKAGEIPKTPRTG
jgi:Kef-type K+ transport system membrane component KefB